MKITFLFVPDLIEGNMSCVFTHFHYLIGTFAGIITNLVGTNPHGDQRPALI